MKNEFKSNLFYIDSFRSTKDNAFKIYPRKLHRYKLGLEILDPNDYEEIFQRFPFAPSH